MEIFDINDKGLCRDFLLLLRMEQHAGVTRTASQWRAIFERRGGDVSARWRNDNDFHVPLGTPVDRVAVVTFVGTTAPTAITPETPLRVREVVVRRHRARMDDNT